MTLDAVQQMIASALSTMGFIGKSHLLCLFSILILEPLIIWPANIIHSLLFMIMLEKLWSMHQMVTNFTCQGLVLFLTPLLSWPILCLYRSHILFLFPVGKLVDSNSSVLFSRDGCVMQDQVIGKQIVRGCRHNRLFMLNPPSATSLAISFFSTIKSNVYRLWLHVWDIWIRIN